MTLLKQSIAWTAVLLYHRLKLTAKTNHRYRLESTTFCTGVIHKLAFYYKNSIDSICTIVGDNGRNTKRIYNRALIACRLNDIEYYLCKKTDNRILMVVRLPQLSLGNYSHHQLSLPSPIIATL